KIALQIVADLVQHGPESPGIDEAVIGQLDERKRIDLLAQTGQRNATAEGGWSEAGPHVGKGRRSRDRARLAEARVSDPGAIEGNAVTAQKPIGILTLALTEQLKIEVPDALDCLHHSVSMVFARYRCLKVSGGWIPRRSFCRIRDLGCHFQQTAAQRSDQAI